MKRRVVTILVVGTAALAGAAVFLFYSLWSKREVLADYRALVSDAATYERLRAEIPFERLGNEPGGERFSIGYASFVFPVGAVEAAHAGERWVKLSNGDVSVIFNPFWSLEKESKLSIPAEEHLPKYVLKGGKPVLRDEANQPHDITLWQFEQEDPLTFYRRVYAVEPKPFYQLCLISYEDLYIYERMLEQKNFNLQKYKPLRFETETLQGLVELMSKYETFHSISVCDPEQRIFQLVFVYFESHVTEAAQAAGVRRFVGSLSLDVPEILARAGETGGMAREALARQKGIELTFEED